jgi:hypothetical protein
MGGLWIERLDVVLYWISATHWIRLGNMIRREIDSIELGFATMAIHSMNDGGSRPGSAPPMSYGIVTYHRHG